MHVPDGFINAPVSAAAGVVAAAAVAVSLRGARRELAGGGTGGGIGADRTAPLAGLVAAFIFAVQMLNFPVAAGTSGHLLGGALAAILVGPYTGVLCVSVVLLMQGVLFADGGLTALGINISDMALTTTVVAYGVFRLLVKVLPRSRRSITVASFAAALLSVPAAAVCFTALYALGGTTDVPIGKVFTAMVGVHVLIGIGEAVITALTVGAVIAVRPDLVHGARDLARPLQLRTSPLAGTAPAAAPDQTADEPTPAPPPPAARPARCGWPASPPPCCAPAASATTPPAAPTAWRRSPTTRAWTPRPKRTPRPTPRSPTTASRTSPTRGWPAASPASSASPPRSPSAPASSSCCAAARPPPTPPRPSTPRPAEQG
ncbi:ABC-type cobalt transport system, permease component [Streptomyces noursei]|nr:ABC-type cobalt transport system, permease component [Streptomyces noursei]